MPELRLIGGGRFEFDFREHPLAYRLWQAIYPRHAESYDEIRQRMSEAAGIPLTFWQVNNCIHHVRKHAYEYGWTIPHVKKGRPKLDGSSNGERKFFPVLPGQEEHRMRVPDYFTYVHSGLRSTMKTIGSMAEHEAVALEMVIDGYTLTPLQKRQLRAASSMFTAASEMAMRILSNIAA